MAEPKTQNDFPETGTVIPNQLRMRATPGGPVIKILSAGTSVTILRGHERVPWTAVKERSGGNQTLAYWLKVSVDGEVGYVQHLWLNFDQNRTPGTLPDLRR